MSKWLVIGGAPEAEKAAPALMRRERFDTVISTNRCLRWGIKPDIYWLSDPLAVELYRKEWEAFTGEIVSNVDLGRPTTPFEYKDKGIPFHGRCSGVLCCRVALSRGATEIHLVGFKGYDPGDHWRDINDQPATTRGAQAHEVNKAQAEAFADMAHDAKFVVHGTTRIEMPEHWERK